MTAATKVPWSAKGAWSHTRSRKVGPSVPGDGMPATGTSYFGRPSSRLRFGTPVSMAPNTIDGSTRRKYDETGWVSLTWYGRSVNPCAVKYGSPAGVVLSCVIAARA